MSDAPNCLECESPKISQKLNNNNLNSSLLGTTAGGGVGGEFHDLSISTAVTSQLPLLRKSNSLRIPVGSAVKAVKSRRSSLNNTSPIKSTENISLRTSRTSVSDGEDDEVVVPIVKKSSSNNIHKEKLVKYLSELLSKKKLQEEEKALREKRSKKRAQILAIRVLNEVLERKLMSDEDKFTGGILPTELTLVTTGMRSKHLKITPELSNAIYNRLVARKTKTAENNESLAKASVSTRDFAEWKKKHALSPETRVFAISGWYPCVKDALVRRGWFHNKDYTSPYFDLKWTNKTMDIEHETLQPWQLTNHFTKNVAITTKIGLLKSLYSLVWSSDMSPDNIIPRAYDMSNASELDEFIQDFKIQKAHSVLKQVYFALTGVLSLPYCPEVTQDDHTTACQHCYPPPPPPPPLRPSATASSLTPTPLPPATSSSDILVLPEVAGAIGVTAVTTSCEVLVNQGVLNSACNVLQKYLRLLDVHNFDAVDMADAYYGGGLITGPEWEALNYDVFQSHILPPAPPISEYGLYTPKVDVNTMTHAELRNYKSQMKIEQSQRANMVGDILIMMPIGEKLISLIHTILLQLRDSEGPQAKINGNYKESKNIWIVKPAAKSRGRGICAFTDLLKLLKYVEAGTTISAQNLWIVQKYMENPLIIANRKFDLRQWVLVTDWNPLTIYFYDEFYARFSVEEYNTDEKSMENAYVHLVNNSIGKNSKNFSNIVTAENGVNVEGFMWSFDEFRKYVEFKTGQKEYVRDIIQPKMKEIVKSSLCCACDSIDHRKNSWELYGFDFMIDDSFDTWLIEINSSPACDYSTKVTEVYVQKALVEILNVVLDVKEWERKDKDSRGARPDTGDWQLIHKGPYLDVPVASFGVDMGIKGAAMKCPPRRTNISTAGTTVLERDGLDSNVPPGASGASVVLKRHSKSEKINTAISSSLISEIEAAAGVASSKPISRRRNTASGPNKRDPVDIVSKSFDDSDSDESSSTATVAKTTTFVSRHKPLAATSKQNVGPTQNSSSTGRLWGGNTKTGSANNAEKNAAIPIKLFSVEF